VTPRKQERGAALLTVLLLVAVMAVLSASALEKLRLSTKVAANSVAIDQARAYAMAAEAIAMTRIGDLVEADPVKTTLAGDWNGRTTQLPVPGGLASMTVLDGGNCFNLNSVVSGDPAKGYQRRPGGVTQFEALMIAIGIPSDNAAQIAGALADWIDTDTVPGPMGAEDDVYQNRDTPYRTANNLVADPSELRAVAGVTPEIYERLRPWVCALPDSDLSPINVNTLAPEQAPLFLMLIPDQITLERARQILSERPAEGFSSTNAFWNLLTLDSQGTPGETQSQVKLRTRWFTLDVTVELGGADMHERALIDAQRNPVTLASRQWGEIE